MKRTHRRVAHGIVAPIPAWGDLLRVGVRAAGPEAGAYLRGVMAVLNTVRQGTLPLYDSSESWHERSDLTRALLAQMTAVGDGDGAASQLGEAG